MQSWSGQFTPKQISYLSSYIKTLRGTKPATPKAQQGEFYVDEVVTVDSAKVVKPDSGKVTKPDTAAIIKK